MTAAKVLYLVDGLGLSGKTKAMVDLIAGLDPQRYQARVLCFDTEGSVLYERLKSMGVDVTEVPCPAGLNLGVLGRVGKVVRRLRPDVVHCYNPRTMLYGGAVARALNIRATLGSLSAFACLTPDQEYRFIPQRLFTVTRRNRLRNRFVCGLVRTVVTVSPSLGEHFCRYNNIDLRRLRIVPYGVDIQRFSSVTPEQIAACRAALSLPAGAIALGSVGRLVEQKDYPTQLRAFAAAAARHPDLHMVLVGEGPLRESLEALARELGIAERVRFAGHRNDVPVVLRSLDIFVLASKFEPYGVALLEAKAAGNAIVATRVNEVPEILGDGATGVLVPPEDPAAMGDAFARLAADAGLRRQLGERAARDSVTRHSLRAAIDSYQAIYDAVRSLPARHVEGVPRPVSP